MSHINTPSIDSVPHSEFLDMLTPEQVQKLRSISQKRTFEKDEVIVNEGEPVNAFYVVESGVVSKNKGEKLLHRLKTNECFGLFHFFKKDPSFATFKVSEKAEVSVFPTDAFINLLKEDIEISFQFTSFLADRVRSQTHLIRDLSPSSDPTVINIAFYDSKEYMSHIFEKMNSEKFGFNIIFFREKLSRETASLSLGCSIVCCFVNDDVGKDTVKVLAEQGVEMVAMRCAGYDNVDLAACKEHKVSVTRVPAYSPYSVAEFTCALLLSLNRKLHTAVDRVRQFNFSLNGLVGFDLYSKTIGVIGTGKIGRCFINILEGMGCNVLCYDVFRAKEIEEKKCCRYVELDELLANSDVISLHAPLLESTKHMLNKDTFAKMKDGVLLVNTSRGGLVNTLDLIEAIKNKKVGGAALDVYEGERGYFFENFSENFIEDQILTQLLNIPNVIVTGHQAFLTSDSLVNIADSTLGSIKEYQQGRRMEHLSNYVAN